ncbi:MAG: hypothetical protein AAF574_14005 [Pseudomonadota bacterium]
MTDSATFNVVTTGKLEPGFELADVQQKLIAAMKLKPEQAAKFFERPRVVKKAQTEANAGKICAQLARMGVSAEVQDTAPAMAPPPPPDKLVFEDSVPPSAEPELAIVDDAPRAASSGDDFACPKCGHVQVKNEQCESCGVWFHKLEPQADTPAPAVGRADSPAALSAAAPAGAIGSKGGAAAPVESQLREAPPDDSALSPAAIGAAFAAALVGAWVWKFVAVTFQFEFGLIAWGIGGAVGAAAAGLGSKGMKAGVVCAVLALGAIALGKYWSYSAAISELQGHMLTAMAEEADSMRGMYEEEMEDGRILISGSGSDDFTRRFMIDRYYTGAERPDDISDAELARFRAAEEPRLRQIAEIDASFEEWQQAMAGSLNDIPILQLMREDLGAFDFIFAFLGIGTAFRLGSKMG